MERCETLKEGSPERNYNLRSFERELDALFQVVRARLGRKDIDHISRVARGSSACEWIGRLLIHFSFEPITYVFGIFTLWIHKQLELTELGHNIQHGTYETIPGAEKFTPERQRWRFRARVPVHAPSWRNSHNRLHHGLTNVIGRDPDARLFQRTARSEDFHWHHRFQFVELFLNWPNIIFHANIAATGVFEVYTRRSGDQEILPDRSWKGVLGAHRRAIAGSVLYFLREYGLFPLLAGPMYVKVAFGNWLSSLMRNLFSAPILYAAHINPSVAIYPKDTRASSRAEWYEMQVLSTQNFRFPPLLSVLSGGLDYQIEHHLFPSLPPNRLREIAPDVRRICEKHGIRYNTCPWNEAVAQVFVQLRRLSRPTEERAT